MEILRLLEATNVRKLVKLGTTGSVFCCFSNTSTNSVYHIGRLELQVELTVLVQMVYSTVLFSTLHFLLHIATQALARDNLCLVGLAADSVPLDELLHLPRLARQRNVAHVFLPSKTGMLPADSLSRLQTGFMCSLSLS